MSTDEKKLPPQPWDPSAIKRTTVTVKVKASGNSIVTSGEVAPFEDVRIRLHDGTIQSPPQNLPFREILRQVAYGLPNLHPSNLPDGTEIHLHLRAAVVVPLPTHVSPTESVGTKSDGAEE